MLTVHSWLNVPFHRTQKFLTYFFRCPVLMVTGDKASFNHTVHRLFGNMSQKMDKSKLELLEIEGVANVLEEKVSLAL